MSREQWELGHFAYWPEYVPPASQWRSSFSDCFIKERYEFQIQQAEYFQKIEEIMHRDRDDLNWVALFEEMVEIARRDRDKESLCPTCGAPQRDCDAPDGPPRCEGSVKSDGE